MALIRLLREQDDRKSFDCGHPDLNGFLHDLDYPTDVATGLWRVWVIVAEQDSTEIRSYYTASPDPVQIVVEGASSPGYSYAAIELRCLATDWRYKRRGYARRLVMHAIVHAVQAANRCALECEGQRQFSDWGEYSIEVAKAYAVDYLFAQAVDEQARDWYLRQKLGFRSIIPNSLSLAITLEEMRDIVTRKV